MNIHIYVYIINIYIYIIKIRIFQRAPRGAAGHIYKGLNTRAINSDPFLVGAIQVHKRCPR